MIAANLVPESLLSQVVAVFDPRRVILVGSRARGDAREDSDYDLVVVLDDEVPDEMLSARRRYEGRRGLAIPADIIPCREGVLKERAGAIGSFATRCSPRAWWCMNAPEDAAAQWREAARWLARAEEDVVVAELTLTRDPPLLTRRHFTVNRPPRKCSKPCSLRRASPLREATTWSC